jgi:peptidoglycan hydrolase CwlO-like protein
MTVNRNTESLQAVEEDVDEIQEDVAHVEGKIDEIETDVDRIQEDVEGIGEELEEINEDETEEVARKRFQAQALSQITKDLEKLLADIETLKKESSKV